MIDGDDPLAAAHRRFQQAAATWREVPESREAIRRRTQQFRAEVLALVTGEVAVAAVGRDSGRELPRHRVLLERIISSLKHGVVESCFYNLKLRAQRILADGATQERIAILEGMRTTLDEVGQAVEQSLRESLPEGPRVGSLLPTFEVVFQQQWRALTASLAVSPPDIATIPSLVDAILDALRAEANRLNSLRVDLNAIVDRAVELEQARLESANLRVSLHMDVRDGRVHGDAGELLAICVELLRNSALHRAGREPGEVRIDLSERPTEILLIVANQPALPPVQPLERLFLSGVSRRPGGGDGLAHLRTVVERACGSARLDFEGGNGIFRVTLSFPTRGPV